MCRYRRVSERDGARSFVLMLRARKLGTPEGMTVPDSKVTDVSVSDLSQRDNSISGLCPPKGRSINILIKDAVASGGCSHSLE